MSYQPGSLYDQKLLDELNTELTKEKWLDDDKNIFMYLNLSQWMWKKQESPEVWEPFEMSVAYRLEWSRINKQQTCEFPKYTVYVLDLIKKDKEEPYTIYKIKSIKIRSTEMNALNILRSGRLLTDQLMLNNPSGEPSITQKIAQYAKSNYFDDYGFLKKNFYIELFKFYIEKNPNEVRRYYAEKWKQFQTNNSSTPKLIRFVVYGAFNDNMLEQFYYNQNKPQYAGVKFPEFITEDLLTYFVNLFQLYLKKYKVNNFFYAVKDMLLDSMYHEAKELDKSLNSSIYSVFYDKYLLKLFGFATKANLHLVLLKLYCNETFIGIKINEYLRNKNLEGLKRIFPVYFFLQHAFFMSYINNLNEKLIIDKKYNLPCGKKSFLQKAVNLMVQDDVRQEIISEQMRVIELFNVEAKHFNCYHFGNFSEQYIQFFQNKDLIDKNISFNQFLSATKFDNNMDTNPILKNSLKYINTVIQINVKLANIEEAGQISTLNYPFMAKAAYTFKFLSNFPSEEEIVFPSGCYFKLKNVSTMTVLERTLNKIVIEVFIPAKVTEESKAQIKKQFAEKETSMFFKKLDDKIQTMENKNPSILIEKFIKDYSKKMTPEIDELFKLFEDKLEVFNLLEEGMLNRIIGAETSKVKKQGFSLVKETNALGAQYKIDIKDIFMTNDQFISRVVVIINKKVIEFIKNSNNYHEINLQLKKLQLISKTLTLTNDINKQLFTGIIPAEKFSQYFDVCADVKKRMDVQINQYDQTLVQIKKQFFAQPVGQQASTLSIMTSKQPSSTKDTIKGTYIEAINNFENLQLIKVQLSDHINENNGFQANYFDEVYKQKVLMLKETLYQFVVQAQEILNIELNPVNIEKLQILLKNFLFIKQVDLKNHLSASDIQSIFTEMFSEFTKKILALKDQIFGIIKPIANEYGQTLKEKSFLTEDQYLQIELNCDHIQELFKIHPDIQQKNIKDWTSILDLLKQYLANNIFYIARKILDQSREWKHQVGFALVASFLKRSESQIQTAKDFEDIKFYFKQMEKIEWLDKFRAQDQKWVQPRLQKLITQTKDLFQKDLNSININLQAENFEKVFASLKMMYQTKEKLEMSKKIQEINQIYRKTLETINEKIVQKIAQFQKEFTEQISQQEWNQSKKMLNNQLQVLTLLLTSLQTSFQQKLYDEPISKNELERGVVNKLVNESLDNIKLFVENHWKTIYSEQSVEIGQGKGFDKLMANQKNLEESKVDYKALYDTVMSIKNNYQEMLIKIAEEYIEKQIVEIQNFMNGNKFAEAKKQTNELVKNALICDSLLNNKISQFQQMVNKTCQAQFQIENQEIKEFLDQGAYDKLKISMEKLQKEQGDDEEKKSLFQNTKEQVLMKKQDEQTQLVLYIQKKLFEKIQDEKVEESITLFKEFDEKYQKFQVICGMFTLLSSDLGTNQIKQGLKDNFNIQFKKLNIFKDQLNFQSAEIIIQNLTALMQYSFSEEFDGTEKADLAKTIEILDQKMKSIPKFQSIEDLDFKKISAIEYKKMYEPLKKVTVNQQKYKDFYEEIRECFRFQAQTRCKQIFEETKISKNYSAGRETIEELLASTDLLEDTLDLRKEFDDLQEQYLKKITDNENLLTDLMKGAKIKIESQDDVQVVMEKINKLKIEKNEDQIKQILKYHEDYFKQKAKFITDALKNDDIVIDEMIAQFKILYLYKRSEVLINEHKYNEVIGQYDQKMITLFGQTAAELRKQNLGLSSEYLMEFVHLYLAIPQIDEYDHQYQNVQTEYQKAQAESFTQALDQIKTIFDQFLQQLQKNIKDLNGQELQKDLKFIDKMYQPTVTHMKQSSFFQNINILFQMNKEIKEKAILNKINELQTIFQDEQNKNFLTKEPIIKMIQDKISESINNIKQQVKDKKYEELANFTKQLRKLSYDLQNEIKDLQEKQILHLKQLQEAFENKLKEALDLWNQQRYKELIQIINEIIPAEKLFNAIQENFFGCSYIQRINDDIKKSLQHEVHSFINDWEDKIKELVKDKSNQVNRRKELREETVEILLKLKKYHDQLHNLKDIVHQCIDDILKFVDGLKVPDKLPEWKGLMKEIGTTLLNIEEAEKGRLAQEIISDFQQFAGLQNDMFNKQTGEQGIDYAFNKSNPAYLRGDDLSESSLRVQFGNYEANFKGYIKYYIMNYNQKDEIPKKAEEIAKELRATISNSILFKWTKQQADEKIPQLLAYIFAYWTITSATIDSDEAQEIDFDSLSSLKKPHCIQVLSILRLLGTDSAQQTSFNHQLIQIGTGEGKSVTLAASAVMLSILGFKVDCVCYSQYLSERDQQSFQKLFDSFGMHDQINYHTFGKLSEIIVNDKGDIRTMTLNFIQQKNIYDGIIQSNQNTNQKRILLIDEVDVFFGKDFYGETYNIQAGLINPNIVTLLKFIWAERNNDLKLDMVLQSVEYQQLVNQDFIRDGKWEEYIKIEIEKMLLDLKEVAEKRHQYLLELNPEDKQWAIAYKYLDSLSFKQKYGYKTCFAYLQEFEDSQGQKITEKQLTTNIMVSFYVSFFSYAEIPKKFDLILGVTGTLDSLGIYEKQVIKDDYKIVKMTYTPSIFGDRSKRFDYKEETDIIIVDQKIKQYDHIIRITQDYLRIERAIVIFFENNLKIMDFQKYLNDKKIIFDKDVNTLEEKTVSKEDVIKKASTTKQVTLATRSFGRGTDFICRDKALKDRGGTLILQTFLVADVSEEIQIQGRTARQGQKGSYKQILLVEDITEEFKKSPEDIAQWQQNNQKQIKQLLSDFRNKLSLQKGDELKQKIGKAKDLDEKAVSYKTVLVNYNSAKPEEKDNLTTQLYNLQKQIATFAQASTKFHFIFILDDSGSMSTKLPNVNPPLTRWEALMQAVTSFIKSREQQNIQSRVTDEFMSVVQFSNRADIMVMREKLSQEILKKVKMRGGTTNYNKALQEMIKILDAEKKLNSKYKINVMFMSDGTPDSNARDYAQELRQINNDYSQFINIFWTIGFGQEDWRYLQSITTGLKEGNVPKAEFKQTIDADALTAEIKKMASADVVFN